MGWYHQIVSGQRSGLGPSLVQAVFRAISVPYGWAVRYRNWRFDTGRGWVFRLPVPVVSVGNLTLGGTGKTPMVAWLARWFHTHHLRVGVISRGYKAHSIGRSDEALQLQQQVPGLVHVENRDRMAAGREAIEKFFCRVLVADDAFQHRRLARDLDIVLLDAVEPFGFGRLFPRGLLREPMESLHRAQVVVLSRADMVGPEKRAEIRHQVAQWASEAVWVEAVHAPVSLVNAQEESLPVESFAGQPVAAFCGIGQPAGFRHTLCRCGYEVAHFRELPDHDAYRPPRLAQLEQWVSRLDVAAVLCTLKDLVKIRRVQLADRPLWALRIEMELVEGRSALEARLRQFLPTR